MARVSRMSMNEPLLEGSLSGNCSKMNQHSYGGTCYCGLDLVLLKSSIVDNPGMWFLRCPLYKVCHCYCVSPKFLCVRESFLTNQMVLQKPKMRCKYFQWVDEVKADYEDMMTMA